MTKNIKITIIVAVVALITLIIVLSSTVFCVKQAEIVWYKEPSAALGQVSNEVLLEKSEVASQSVFFWIGTRRKTPSRIVTQICA